MHLCFKQPAITKKKNRNAFLIGLAAGAVVESVAGFLKFVLSSGQLRGIFMCIHSYQIELFFILALLLLANKINRYFLTLGISILILGIVATQTRSGLPQYALGLSIVLFYAHRKKYVLKVLPIVGISIILSAGVSFAFKSIAAGTTQRVEEALEGGGTIAYRYYLWDKAIGAFLSHPLTGIGTGGFGKQLSTLPQVFNMPMEGEKKTKPISPHSSLLLVLSETGLVGLAAYLGWVIAIVQITLAVFKHKQVDYFAVACAVMMIVFIACDAWSVNSFYPNMSYLAAYLIGYLKDTQHHAPQ